jgi:hypothetical protein
MTTPNETPIKGPSLEERMRVAVDAEKFTALEMLGFSRHPVSAIRIGVAIGYRLACKDISEGFTK